VDKLTASQKGMEIAAALTKVARKKGGISIKKKVGKGEEKHIHLIKG